MSCSETTADLESDEIVEPETEAISKGISEAPSLGNNNTMKVATLEKPQDIKKHEPMTCCK